MLTRNDAPPCTPRAVVVGGGFGGIAAALRLRAKGYRVTLVERLAAIGGRAQVFERDGFRHDAGPTVITAPFLFDELFELFGKRRADYVRFVPLEPWYRFRFDDGDTFDYCGTIEGTLAEIRRISPGDVDGYLRLVAHSKELCDVGFTGLAAEPFHKPSTMIRQIPSLARLRTYRTVWQLVSAYLSHPKLRQAFSIQPLLVGGNPFDTTSIYGLIHYLERKWGVFFAMGGTGALVAAFERLMREEGIEIRCETTVAEIAVEGRRATGVVLEDGARIAADVVVSNADPMHLYRSMVPERVQTRAVRLKRRSRLSMGLYVLYFGTRRTYPGVAHHTIWMGPRYRELGQSVLRRHPREREGADRFFCCAGEPARAGSGRLRHRPRGRRIGAVTHSRSERDVDSAVLGFAHAVGGRHHRFAFAAAGD